LHFRLESAKRLKVALGRLTPGQREELKAELAAMESRPAATTLLEGRFAGVLACPHCTAGHVIKHGTANGLQRYRCRGCGKTFCALTGTPLAGLHKRGKWLDHVTALSEGLILRKVAERLHIAVSTAHRWRHRFLAAPKTVQSHALAGIAEADETYFLRSHKGQRQGLNRPPRKRGGRAKKRGLSAEQVPVLVVRDRSGGTADFILAAADKKHVAAVLKPLLASDSILCTDGSGSLAAAAKEIGIEHHALNLTAGIRVIGPWHVQNVNAYHSRLKDFMRRFRGVATRYLDSYLGWFRTIERSPTAGLKPAAWLAMSFGQPA
jgi:transposase-like protein